MMGVVVTTGAVRHAKLQSNRHHQHTNTQPFREGGPKNLGMLEPHPLGWGMAFLSPNQQCQSTEWKKSIITFHGLGYPKLTWGLPASL